MHCSVCGEQLPAGATACPRCGSFVSYGSGATMYNPTVMSTGNTPAQGQPVPPQSQQPTGYGSNPYGVPDQNPYGVTSPSNPYPYTAPNPYAPADPYTLPATPYNVQQSTPLPPPVQYQRPPQQQKRPNIGLIVGLAVLAIIVVAGGFFALSRSPSGGLTQAQTNATATAKAGNGNTNGNPYSPHTGTLVLNDPMTDNSRGYKWDEATMTGAGTCGFSGGAYHITSIKQNTSIICDPEASAIVFSNLTFEAKLKIITGDEAGIVIRVDQQKQTDYIFSVDTQGNYYLFADDGPNSQARILRQGANGAILKGLNQTNLLAVVANGSSMYLYVNGQYIDQGTDSRYAQGQIGVYGSGSQTTFDVVASDARVWKM